MRRLIYPIFIFILFSCSKDNEDTSPTASPAYNIWTGPKIEFIKQAF